MSVKRFGKLAGHALTAFECLRDTSPYNTTLPYVAQPPGTKMISFGENSPSRTVNRLAGALLDDFEGAK